MKHLSTLLPVLALVIAVIVPAVAAPRGELLVGTVRSVDTAARTFVVEDPRGTHTLRWNGDTAFLTRPAPGLKMKIYLDPGPGEIRLALRVGLAEKPRPRRR